MRAFILKSVVLMVVLVLLAVAVAMATSVVGDRIKHRAQAGASILDSHAGAQRLVGPTLLLSYEERYVEEEPAPAGAADAAPRRVVRVRKHSHAVLPQQLSIVGDMAVSARTRGLFKVNVYATKLVMTGFWVMPAPSELGRTTPDASVRVDSPGDVVVAVSEARGLRSMVMKVGESELELSPGARRIAGWPAIEGRMSNIAAASTRLPFRIELELDGAETFSFVPIARGNQVAIKSNWPHPSFVGAMLPTRRDVAATGFDATWQVSSIASEAPRRWRAALEERNEKNAERAGADLAADAVGFRLVEPVDIYTLSDRATKYAILFIALTMGGFVLCEVLGRWPVHPVQYFLVGLAMVTFYLLLLSLSERVGFVIAYLSAAVACVGLIGYYIGHVLGGWRRSAPMTLGLAIGYGALYALIRSEDNTLLIGSLLIFATLAAVMIATRGVDWYHQFETPPRSG